MALTITLLKYGQTIIFIAINKYHTEFKNAQYFVNKQLKALIIPFNIKTKQLQQMHVNILFFHYTDRYRPLSFILST